MTLPRRSALGPALFCLSIAAASCADGEPAALDGGNAFVSGSVTVEKTGVGVPNMIIALVRGADVVATAATDATGSFGFDRQPAGDYTARLVGLELTPFRPNFTALEPAERTFIMGSDPVELTFTLVGLLPPRVSGTVRCSGTLIEGARVRVIGGETDTSALTNVLGRFGVNDLDVGFHTVVLDQAPCSPSPAFHVVNLRLGQGIEVDFAG